MWPNPQFPADLVTFTEEILNEKFHFLCSDLFFIILEPLKPVIQHGPAGKAQRRLLVQVEGLKNVGVHIGDDMETLNGTVIYIR